MYTFIIFYKWQGRGTNVSVVMRRARVSQTHTHDNNNMLVRITLLGECFDTAFSFRRKNRQSMPTVGRDIITLPQPSSFARRSRTPTSSAVGTL